MSNFLDLLAAGASSLSFEKRRTEIDFGHEPCKREITIRMPMKPRTPEEIMRAAWEDVGNRMREAMGIVAAEYGKEFAE